MSDINCCGKEEMYGEVVPGWMLVRLIESTQGLEVGQFVMGEGSWGLTWCSDPSFVFDLPPCLDDDTDHSVMVAQHYEQRLTGRVFDGYLLGKACVEAGWNEMECGLGYWLADRMYKHLEAMKWEPLRVW